MPRLSRERDAEIEIALSALCIYSAPGQTMTFSEIADVCNCSPNTIHNLCKKAMAKATRHATDMGLFACLAAEQGVGQEHVLDFINQLPEGDNI